MDYKLEVGLYGNGRPAIQVYDDEGAPFCTLSVNIPDAVLEENEICIKAWDLPSDFLQMILASGKFDETGKQEPAGYTSAPVWRIRCPELLRAIEQFQETTR
uniref:hypothetical protein n=1 Tax=Pseudomonas aeruginosa TaxID=287 RepID=UPI00093B4C17|nr:hypothetical protein [Pseudomonas aeruginosa]